MSSVGIFASTKTRETPLELLCRMDSSVSDSLFSDDLGTVNINTSTDGGSVRIWKSVSGSIDNYNWKTTGGSVVYNRNKFKSNMPCIDCYEGSMLHSHPVTFAPTDGHTICVVYKLDFSDGRVEWHANAGSIGHVFFTRTGTAYEWSYLWRTFRIDNTFQTNIHELPGRITSQYFWKPSEPLVYIGTFDAKKRRAKMYLNSASNVIADSPYMPPSTISFSGDGLIFQIAEARLYKGTMSEDRLELEMNELVTKWV